MPAGQRSATGLGRDILLPCALLFGAMFNLTLVVAGLKEFVIDELGGSLADATLFFTVETLAYILFAPLWGLLSDRFRTRKPFVVVGFLGSAILYSAYGVLESVELLLLLRFLQGAFSVMGWSVVMALVLDTADPAKRGRFMGMMGGSLIFGVALGAPVGGYLTRWFGARAPLATAAALFALLALAALLLRRGSPLTGHLELADIGRALRSRPRLVVPFLFHFVDRLAVGLFVVIFPLYLDSLGAQDPAVRGRYLALFLLPFAFLQFFTGRMAERTGPYPPLLLGSSLYGLVLCAVGYSGLFLLGPVMVTLGVLASVMFPPAILLTAQLSDARTRGSAMGGFNLAGSLGFAVGPVLGGAATALYGFGVAFVLCGVAEILLVAVTLLLFRRWARREGESET